MKKKEAEIYIKEKNPYGCGLIILDIYDDDEEIPKELVELLIQRYEPRPFVIYTGREGVEQFEKIMDEFMKKEIGM